MQDSIKPILLAKPNPVENPISPPCGGHYGIDCDWDEMCDYDYAHPDGYCVPNPYITGDDEYNIYDNNFYWMHKINWLDWQKSKIDDKV